MAEGTIAPSDQQDDSPELNTVDKFYLVAYQRTMNCVVFTVVTGDDIVSAADNSGLEAKHEVSIMDNNSQHKALILFTGENFDTVHFQMLKLKAHGIMATTLGRHDYIPSNAFVLVQYDFSLTNSTFAVLRFDQTTMEKFHARRNKPQVVHTTTTLVSAQKTVDAIILRYSEEATELYQQLLHLKECALAADYPLEHDSTFPTFESLFSLVDSDEYSLSGKGSDNNMDDQESGSYDIEDAADDNKSDTASEGTLPSPERLYSTDSNGRTSVMSSKSEIDALLDQMKSDATDAVAKLDKTQLIAEAIKLHIISIVSSL